MPNTLAHRYLEIFFHSRDFEALYAIFHPEMHFKGPFFQSQTAEAYIQSLCHDPPGDCHYENLELFMAGTEKVCLKYDFCQGPIRVPMAQFFRMKSGLIHEVQLIFDPSPWRA